MKKMTLPLVMASLMAAPMAASAEFIPRVGVAIESYSVEGPYYENFFGVDSVDSTYFSGNFGATFVLNNGMYIDGAFSSSIGAKTDSFDSVYGSGDEDFDRIDTSITLGMPIGQSARAFVGYRQDESTISFSNLNNTCVGGCVSWNEDTFETSGIFFGGTYLINNVALTGALAFMDATWSDDSGWEDDDDSVGVSLSAGFAINALSLSVKYQSISFDDFDVDQDILALGASYSFR